MEDAQNIINQVTKEEKQETAQELINDAQEEIKEETQAEEKVRDDIHDKFREEIKEEKKEIQKEADDDKRAEEKREKVVKFFKGIGSKLKEGPKETKKEKEEEKKEEIDLEKKREEFITFVKTRWNYITYIILAGIIWFGAWVRTRNLPLLKDITTGKYVPLALDPHVFLRYAKYIVEHGKLFAHDPGRFVPIGFEAASYEVRAKFIVGIYKIMSVFNPNTTIEFADVIYPVIAFVIMAIFFFLIVKRIFNEKIALIATFFLAVAPSFLYRTMAGFSDHEAMGTMLMFISLYFYIAGWQSKNTKLRLGMGVLSGLFAGWMGLTWGGWKFLLLIIGAFTLIEFLLERMDSIDSYQYILWIASFTFLVVFFPAIHSLKSLLTSTSTGLTYIVLGLIILKLIIENINPGKIKQKIKTFVPLNIGILIICSALAIIVISIFDASIFSQQISKLFDMFVRPLGTDRWMLTVAEQHQPYFTDWKSQFGPTKFKIPFFFTLFFLGSILLVKRMTKPLKEKSSKITIIYALFISAFIFSRYSRNSTLNGSNTISLVLYLGSFIAFFSFIIIAYLNSHYKKTSLIKEIKHIDKKYIFVTVWFILMVVAARGASRLFYILTPIATILAAYFALEGTKTILKIKDKLYRYTIFILMAYLILSTAYAFSLSTKEQAKRTGPSYNRQWQQAGKWIREETPIDSVFGHWWDYGYWVQSGGERASFVDGANQIKYWNYLNGRHVLMGQTQEEALKMLKAHEVTHFLIISDEIGKMTAYSSIGSNEDYDRYSWITTFRLQPKQTQETRNSTIYTYTGGYNLDDDFTYKGKTFYKGNAGIGAIFLPIENVIVQNGNETTQIQQIAQPTAVVVQSGLQERVPLECVYVNGQMYKFENEGLKGCFRIIPELNSQGQLTNPIGGGLYVSHEGVKALWTNLFLFEQKNPDYDTSAFKLAYNDERSMPLALYGGRVIGPLKIWEVEYSENITLSDEELEYYTGGNELLPDFFFEV